MLKRILLIAVFASSLFAGDITPEEYQVEITKIETFDSTSSTWKTMYEGNGGYISLKNTTTAGASVAGLLAGWKSPLVNANYTKTKVTVNRTIKIKACDLSNLCTDGTLHAYSTAYADATAATAVLASGFPNFLLVWPSNCGSLTLTEIIDVKPSRASLPAKPLSLSFNKPSFFANSLSVLVNAILKPVKCIPPSDVSTLLAKVPSKDSNSFV